MNWPASSNEGETCFQNQAHKYECRQLKKIPRTNELEELKAKVLTKERLAFKIKFTSTRNSSALENTSYKWTWRIERQDSSEGETCFQNQVHKYDSICFDENHTIL